MVLLCHNLSPHNTKQSRKFFHEAHALRVATPTLK